jgi:transposase
MGRAELQWIQEMRFEGLLDRHERGELSQQEAAEMLGISERTFRRWGDRLREEGPPGLRDRRIVKPSSRKVAQPLVKVLHREPAATLLVQPSMRWISSTARLHARLR